MTDEAIARAMAPLLARGRAALRAYILTLPEFGRPLGGVNGVGPSMNIVAHADFCKHPALVLRYVVLNRAPTHVLCENGHLCALFAKHATTW